jgi:CRP-like cAMP-binding protein
MRHSTRVLPAPAPDVLLQAFDASAITYKARFWIDDFEHDELARDDVRTAIYYAFQRHRIEIPWPIQIEYSREWKEPEPHEQADRIERVLSRVDLFAEVPSDFRRELALAADHVVYGTGETIVRQGDPGQSMFVVAEGVVSVVLGPARNEVARIEAGGHFGEMSLLTGEPRTATVLAMGDVEVIELNADLFRRLAEADPHVIERIAESAAARQSGLAAARSASLGTVSADTGTLMARMKKFLHFA